MRKTVSALRGNANQGKSETIKEVARLLIAAYPAAAMTPAKIDFSKDIKLILTLDGLKIGIESQGDPNSRLPKSLEEFALAGCDLIICATRTSGETVNAVQNLHAVHNYDIVWVSNYRSRQKSNSALNKLSAQHIFELVQEIIAGKI